MTDPTLEFFEQYRSKKIEIENLKSQLRVLDEDAQRLRHNIRTMNEEVESMRKIITTMVDNGWDPVEAKLRTEETDRQFSFWTALTEDSNMISSITLQSAMASSISQLTVSSQYNWGATGATGSIGSTGAIGAIGSMQGCYSYPYGANGSTGA